MPSAKYEVKWTPEPSEPIVETYSHIPFAPVRISAEVEASGSGSGGGETRAGDDSSTGGAEDTPTVTGYACTPSEALSGLEIVTTKEGVDVSAPNALPTAFPFLDLEYQIKRRTYHCKTFEELPEEADEIISFKPDPSTQREVSLRVVAQLSDGTESAETFTLRLLQNFDSGKEQLKEAVNARRLS